MSSDAELVAAVRSGQRDAFGTLAERWFDRCWEVAWRILRDRDLAADVAQDTLLTAWRQLDRLQQAESFGGWVLRIARNRALDRLARERRAVPTAEHDTLEPAVSGNDPTGPEAAVTRAESRDLVWAAAAALGERDASLLDLHLRHGLEPHELAAELGIAPNAAHQALFRMRKRLGAAITAWLLWREDAPDCVVLRAELAAAGHRTFGPAVVRTIDRHVRACETCSEERQRVAAPAALFSAVPLVAAPASLRATALRSLADAGVPVGDVDGGPGGDAGGDTASGDGAPPGDAPSANEPADGTPSEHQTGPDAQHVAPPADGPDAPGTSMIRRGPSMVLRTLVPAVVALAALAGWLWWRTNAVSPAPAVASDLALPAPTGDAAAAEPDGPAALADAPSATPDAPGPAITVLSAEFTGRCESADRGRFRVAWTSAHGSTATLARDGGEPTPVALSGEVTRCAADGAAFTVRVEGAGGSAARTVRVNVPSDGSPERGDPDPAEPGSGRPTDEPGSSREPDGSREPDPTRDPSTPPGSGPPGGEPGGGSGPPDPVDPVDPDPEEPGGGAPGGPGDIVAP